MFMIVIHYENQHDTVVLEYDAYGQQSGSMDPVRPQYDGRLKNFCSQWRCQELGSNKCTSEVLTPISFLPFGIVASKGCSRLIVL